MDLKSKPFLFWRGKGFVSSGEAAFRGCAPFSSGNIKFGESGTSGLCYLENQTSDDENAPFWACSHGCNTITGLPRDDKITALKTSACSLTVREVWR